MFENEGHWIDDPLDVVNAKPDFSGLGMEPKHKQKGTMTNKECIERWADSIIPAVFKAEDALQKAKPEWKERLAALNAGTSQEDGAKVAKEYCREIATIIVAQGVDYVPDGSIDGDADFT